MFDGNSSRKSVKLSELVCSGLTPSGLITTTVKITEDGEWNGHDTCRETCCKFPQCKLYQVHKKYADTKHYKAGSKMTCYLGMVGSKQAPKFQCVAGTSHEGKYRGGVEFSRGYEG